jgi:hypothetical protein
MPRALTLIVAIACSARIAAADPTVNRVITAPTAWLPPAGAVIGTAGMDHRFDADIILGYGFGGLASVELGTDTDVRGCTDCSQRPEPLFLTRAAFRMGARQNAWFTGMPALVLGVRTTVVPITGRDDFERVRVTDAYVVASRVVGPLRLHAGGSLVDAGFGDYHMGPKLRPLGGFEWTPPQYPKTSLLGDVAWVALLRADKARPEWLAGWGVRYQALPWGSIELAVRHREDEGLGDSTVLVRVNGLLDPARSGKATPAAR